MLTNGQKAALSSGPRMLVAPQRRRWRRSSTTKDGQRGCSAQGHSDFTRRTPHYRQYTNRPAEAVCARLRILPRNKISQADALTRYLCKQKAKIKTSRCAGLKRGPVSERRSQIAAKAALVRAGHPSATHTGQIVIEEARLSLVRCCLMGGAWFGSAGLSDF